MSELKPVCHAEKPTGRSCAILIGIDEYQNGIPKLENAVHDIDAVEEVLHRDHGYEVRCLRNTQATLAGINQLLAISLSAAISAAQPVAQPMAPPMAPPMPPARSGAPQDICKPALASRELSAVRNCINGAIPSELQMGGGATELVFQTIAQVVIDRATQSAWDLLTAQLRGWLGCQPNASSFAKTCGLLANLRMQELVAQPDSLLTAVAVDLLDVVKDQLPLAPDKNKIGTVPQHLAATLGATGDVLNVFVDSFKQNWKQDGMKDPVGAAGASFKQIMLDQLTQMAIHTTCESAMADSANWGSILPAAEWILGTCLLSTPSTETNFKARLAKCTIEASVKECHKADKDSAKQRVKDQVYEKRVKEYISIITNMMSDTKQVKWFLHLPFMVARDAPSSCLENPTTPDSFSCQQVDKALDALETLVFGIYGKDWIKITAGAADLLATLNGPAQKNKDAYLKALQVVTAISQLAYHSKDSPDDGKARRDVLENLMKSLVNRKNRVGWVLSLGGSFGVAAAYRAALNELGTAGLQAPFALPLGFGLQQYQAGHDCGFHLQVSVLDIGQYVAWEGKDFSVKPPNLQDAVSFSVNFGIWFGNRQIPIFVGPRFGVAPFARGGTPSLFAGGLFGAYVPFLDFN